MGQLTGLDMDTAEDLQVVNYGIGGHYEPHFDYARVNASAYAYPNLGWGNRIATWIFYVSTGSTNVFSFLQKEEVNAFKDLGWGNRIATWIFYVSQMHVQLGLVALVSNN